MQKTAIFIAFSSCQSELGERLVTIATTSIAPRSPRFTPLLTLHTIAHASPRSLTLLTLILNNDIHKTQTHSMNTGTQPTQTILNEQLYSMNMQLILYDAPTVLTLDCI